MKSITEKYKARVQEYTELSNTWNAKYSQFSLVRLIVFIIAIAVIILLFSYGGVAAGISGIVIFLLGFSRFIVWHSKIKTQAELYENLQKINERELSFLKGDYSVFGNGEEYINPEHPYTTDLDFFGDYSFFQFSNRTASAIGNLRLADYLRYPSKDLTEILDRQEAIKELQEKLDWRQSFQAVGLSTNDSLKHINELKKWLDEEPYISNNKVWVTLIYLAPIFALAGLTLWLTVAPWYLAMLFFVPAGFALKKTLEKVNVTHYYTNKANKVLSVYAAMIKQVESQSFNSPKLQDLGKVFSSENKNASEQIEKLSYIISQLNLRYNFFAIFFNLSFLSDLKQIRRLEKWRATHKELLPLWFNALAEFEALNSFATIYYNNPEWTFPDINKSTLIHADELGHPLISKKERVCNDINIPTNGHLKLVTGSNMAGKSTFMRTVGLNIVLAQIGLPVCAKKLSMPLLKVYTSMRTADALHESTSSFYAELKRLKFIIEAVENGDNIFFLLDEILKGTNSRDRHKGSKALIKQLIEAKGSGIIATHDLELGELEAQYNGAVENLRIEVQIHDGKLHFDYKIKKGVSESFNATILMQQMGIKV